jgi:hypothetical protein
MFRDRNQNTKNLNGLSTRKYQNLRIELRILLTDKFLHLLEKQKVKTQKNSNNLIIFRPISSYSSDRYLFVNLFIYILSSILVSVDLTIVKNWILKCFPQLKKYRIFILSTYRVFIHWKLIKSKLLV